MKNEKGFTLLEVLFVLAVMVSIALAGGLVYMAFHFISKYW